MINMPLECGGHFVRIIFIDYGAVKNPAASARAKSHKSVSSKSPVPIRKFVNLVTIL